MDKEKKEAYLQVLTDFNYGEDLDEYNLEDFKYRLRIITVDRESLEKDVQELLELLDKAHKQDVL